MAATNDRSGLGSGRDLRLCQHGRHQPSTSTCSIWARLARLCLSTNTVVISAQACFDCDAMAGATGWPLIDRDSPLSLNQHGRHISTGVLRLRCDGRCDWLASDRARLALRQCGDWVRRAVQWQRQTTEAVSAVAATCGCANTVVISPAPAPALYGLGWLASVSQPTRSSYQHRRASIAMREQVRLAGL